MSRIKVTFTLPDKINNFIFFSQISGFHGGVYDDDTFLYCSALEFRVSRPTFVLPPLSGAIIEAVYTSETSICFHRITPCYILDSCHLKLYSPVEVCV
jgi:hypothetical protein